MSLKTFDHAFYSKKVKKMSWEQLLFVIKDCQRVLKAWPETPNNGYYTDEILYCSDEIRRRNQNLIKELR